MRCYSGQRRFYVGVDLYARTLYIHVLDHQGKTVFEQNLPADPDAILDALAPFYDEQIAGPHAGDRMSGDTDTWSHRPTDAARRTLHPRPRRR